MKNCWRLIMVTKIRTLLISFGYRKIGRCKNFYAKPVGYGLMTARFIREDTIELSAMFKPTSGTLAGTATIWNAIELTFEVNESVDRMARRFATGEISAGIANVAKQFGAEPPNFISTKEQVETLIEGDNNGDIL